MTESGILNAASSVKAGLCTVYGRVKTSRSGGYGVYCVYFDDAGTLHMVSELDYRVVDSAIEYGFSGSFNNSDSASTEYLIVLIETMTPDGEFEGITQTITPGKMKVPTWVLLSAALIGFYLLLRG